MYSPEEKKRITIPVVFWWFSAGFLMWSFGCFLGAIATNFVRAKLIGFSGVDWAYQLRLSGQYQVYDIISIASGGIIAGIATAIVGLIVLWPQIPRHTYQKWFILNVLCFLIAICFYELIFRIPFLSESFLLKGMIGAGIGGVVSGIAPFIAIRRRYAFAGFWIFIGFSSWVLLFNLVAFFQIDDVP